MELKRVGTIVSMKGPEATFTGQVRVEMLSTPPAVAGPSARASQSWKFAPAT
jgi:hypothetical protein